MFVLKDFKFLILHFAIFWFHEGEEIQNTLNDILSIIFSDNN